MKKKGMKKKINWTQRRPDTLFIYRDEDADPRNVEEQGSLWKTDPLRARQSVSLGDKHSYEDIEEFFEENPEKDGITRKVYGYCHSGTEVLKIAESNPFHDPVG